MTFALFLIVLALGVAGYVLAQRRALAVSHGRLTEMHSLPSYHGLYTFLWTVLAGWIALLIVTGVGDWLIDATLTGRITAAMPEANPIDWRLVLSDAKAIARGQVTSQGGELRQSIAGAYSTRHTVMMVLAVIASLGAAASAGWAAYKAVSLQFRARNRAETIIRRLLLAMASIAILTTVGIVLSLIFETVRFFADIGWRIDKFLFGLRWSPLAGVFEGDISADNVGSIPLFAGTLMITLIAMLVAVPVGLFSAIFLSDFATKRVRAFVKPFLEILAGIPTVVYGFFAAITMAPFLRDAGEVIGLEVASQSALAAGVVMGIMIIPFISSLSDDVINSVPQTLRDGSLSVGATRAETMRLVVLPAALPGIVSAILLGISKAIGETMIVVMAAGQGPNLTANPLEAMTTVTVQIVALITGDTEAETAAGPAFTLGFTLFVMTLLMNVLAQRIVRRYRELYE